jgi:transcriptional regulator with XRE-family HTH domain
MHVNFKMTPAQVRAARKLLGWSRDRLAGASGVGVHALQIYESTGHMQMSASEPDRLNAVHAALLQAGIVFTSGSTGVRLVQRRRTGSAPRITPKQCRAARDLLGVTQEQFGRATHLNPLRISAFERHGRLPGRGGDAWLRELRAALENAGIEFIDAEGVRLKDTAPR